MPVPVLSQEGHVVGIDPAVVPPHRLSLRALVEEADPLVDMPGTGIERIDLPEPPG